MGKIKRAVLLGGINGFFNGLILFVFGEVVIASQAHNLVLCSFLLPLIGFTLSLLFLIYLFNKLIDRFLFFFLSDSFCFLCSLSLMFLFYLYIMPLLFSSRDIGDAIGLALISFYLVFFVLLVVGRVIALLYLLFTRKTTDIINRKEET